MSDEPCSPHGSPDRMDPVPAKGPRAPRQRKPLPDQIDRVSPSRAKPAAAEGYVRLHVRVEPDGLSLQNIMYVEGPLIAYEELHGDLAYEVTVARNRVASASLPDLGMRRAFRPPESAPAEEGHYLAAAPGYEFIAPVPKDAISLKALPRVDVALYGIKEGPAPGTEGPELPATAARGRSAARDQTRGAAEIGAGAGARGAALSRPFSVDQLAWLRPGRHTLIG